MAFVYSSSIVNNRRKTSAESSHKVPQSTNNTRITETLLYSDISATVPTASLTLSTLVKNCSRRHIEIGLLIFPRKQVLIFLAKMSQIRMICRILFSNKNKKNIINFSSVEVSR